MITVPMTIAITEVSIPAKVSVNEPIKMFISANYTAGGEAYHGQYAVTPRLYQQALETKDKIMSDNVIVYSIPITETDNPQGGKTVVIG